MSRTEAGRARLLIIVVALALIVPLLPVLAAAGEGAVTSGAPLAPQEANYNTYEVSTGSYVKTASAGAYEFFPNGANIKYRGVNAKFVEYKVVRGDEVEKGDVLAVLSIYSSPVELERAQLNLTRAEEGYEQGKRNRLEAIRLAQDGVSLMSSDYDRQMERLRIERLEIEYQAYCLDQERNIKLMRDAVEGHLENRSNTELIAPFSGIIESTTYKRVDDMVFSGEELITLYSPEGMLLSVENGNGAFRYNARVTVETGIAKQRVTLTGRVVASDSMIAEGQRKGYALIELDEYDDSSVSLRNMVATVDTYRLDGVVIVPRKAVTMESGKYYVTKLSDGAAKKRYVEFGYSNVNDVWVASGLNPGDLVIID